MKEIILAKYGEMALKGLNKNGFEDILLKNIRRRLKPLGSFTYAKAQSTIYITPGDAVLLEEALARLEKIVGIAAPSCAGHWCVKRTLTPWRSVLRNIWRRCCPLPTPLK